MNKLNMAYCNECEDLVEFDFHDEVVTETYKGVKIQYDFRVARCKCCHSEVAASVDTTMRNQLRELMLTRSHRT